ncbi:phage tail protein [Thalassotalea sp. 1_MG-2023]|uniref:phage tail protein n=1 Tax=Thalassotalea sp. 1_MG-2023 TaxID=3062680 RepID=UPI0026E1F05B|nr:phage tail protein [Thalassotalea sp. 1_MG-2023]MDO6426242.1 phage tail protein [Thalassotalea sp. 1_MG-2023]
MSNNIQLPTWLNGEQTTKLAKVANQFWQEFEQKLWWWLEQINEDEAALPILNLLAWERDITRLENEPVELYRLRIKHALANAEDAGSTQGMEAIFKRLGFGYMEINERIPGYDWDMVGISMIESEFADKQQLVEELIRQYGRTCRRYFLQVLNVLEIYVLGGQVEFNKEVVG